MQIKSITCHDVYNHGASLQAYALQAYMEAQGHDVQVIDYKPPYLSGHYRLWIVANPRYDRPFLKQLYLVGKLPERLLSLKRKWAFDKFTKRYLHLTTRRYHSNEELKAYPPEADVYIAGSDQIWNTFFQNGRDAAFYLDFAPKGKRRVAYAASFATKDVADNCRGFVRRMLQGLDCISIREAFSLQLLASLGRDDGIAVCDPVFLLSKDQWNVLLPKERQSNEKYILVYDTDPVSPIVKKIAQEVAKATNLPIWNVGSFRLPYACRQFCRKGPLDFVRLIRDSELVISNSFHATAFSLIFHKHFFVVNRSESINERMLSLLDDVGLSHLLVSTFSKSFLHPIDYDVVQRYIDAKIDLSKKFLKNVLVDVN